MGKFRGIRSRLEIGGGKGVGNEQRGLEDMWGYER